MKQNVRKVLAISGMAIVIGATGFSAYDASANAITKKAVTKTIRGEKIKEHRNLRIIPGVVSEVSGNTITMKRGNKTFTVSAGTSTSLVDRKWSSISLTDIKAGDKLRVRGSVSGGIVSAQRVRDMSLPKTTN